MAKQTGLGHNLYVGGVDLSGDIAALDEIGGGNEPLVMTAINQSAVERAGGLRDGRMTATSFFNTAADGAHTALSTLPTTDVQLQYWCGTTVGVPVACLVGKQLGYDGTRGEDGSMKFNVETQGNGWGLEWADGLTAGIRSDSTGTNGASIDYGADAGSTLFGGAMYLQIFSFTGTLASITVQDSTDDSAWANVPGLASSSAIGDPGAIRISTTATTTQIDRYVRVITTGTFTEMSFAVAVVKNLTAVTH